MKAFTKKRVAIFVIFLIGIFLIAFPFQERAQYKKDLKNYRATLAQLDTHGDGIASARLTLDFPSQPLNAPYPATWTELLDWVGSADRYEASNEELADFKNALHLQNTELMAIMALFGLHERRDRKAFMRPSESNMAALEEFIQPNREMLDRLHQIRQANALFLDPHFDARAFKKLNRKEMRRWHGSSVGKLPFLLHLEAVYLLETDQVDEALNSLLTMLRLSEHFIAGWNFTSFGYTSSRRKLTMEYLVERGNLSAEQFEQMIDWTLYMEPRIDYTNALVALQIKAQQTAVIGNDRVKPIRKEPELAAEASLVEMAQFSWQKIRYHTLNSEMGMSATHHFFLRTPSRYRYQSIILEWCTGGLDARNAATFRDAAEFLPVDSGLPDRDAEERDRVQERVRRIHQEIWSMIREKFELITQIRSFRAACMLELYKLSHGTYPQTVEQAAQDVGLAPPLGNITNEPLRVVFEDHRYQIEANDSRLETIRDPEKLAQVVAAENVYGKTTFRRYFNSSNPAD